MSYQPIDQKKEDFRKYLEKNGVIENLTKALVGLYEESEKPDNPLDYLQKLITGAGSSNNSDLLAQMEDLKVENQKLKERVAELENSLAAATNAESPNTFAAGQTQESPTSETGNPSDAPASANQDS